MIEKKNTQNLQQTIRFFETLLRASADGIVITDSAKNIIFVNETFCEFFSRKRQDVIETNLFVLFTKLGPNANDTWNMLESQIQEHGIARNVEFAMSTGEGMKYFSVNSSLLDKIDIEEPGLIISIWRDDTERKMAKEALQLSHDELEKRNAYLETYVKAFVDRELRMVELKKIIAGYEKKIPGMNKESGNWECE